MNILLLNWRDTTHPKSGGAEYVTLKHAASWIKAGHVVTWFTSRYAGSPSADTIDGISIIRRGNVITVFFHAFLYYICHRRRFDLIVDEVHGIPFFSRLYARCPVVVFIHEVAGVLWDVMYPPSISWIGKVFERAYLSLYRGSVFWTDAPSTVDELVSLGIPRRQCIAISCPIDRLSVSGSIRKENFPTFLFVGRIVKMKGVEDILSAFSRITTQIPLACLWIVGEGERRYVKMLKNMANSYHIGERVTWWGKVTEEKKIALMKKSHVLLHASVKEGWGLVVLEAASQGTPAVAYPSGGLRDTVMHNKTGLLTKNKDSAELADLAVSLMENKKLYISLQKGASILSSSYTWKEATEQSVSLLERVYNRQL